MFNIKLEFPIWASLLFFFCLLIYSVFLIFGISSLVSLKFRLLTFGFSLIIAVLFYALYKSGTYLPNNLQGGLFFANAPFELAGAIFERDSIPHSRFFTSEISRFSVAFGFVRVIEEIIEKRILCS